MNQKYGALRVISTINKIFGYISFVAGSIAGISSFANSQFSIGFIIIIVSAFVGLLLIASGEIIHVIIDIESNTQNQQKIGLYTPTQFNSSQLSGRGLPIPKTPDTSDSISSAKNDASNIGDLNIRKNSVGNGINNMPIEIDVRRIEATSTICGKGFFVETIGVYPEVEWIIKKDFKLVRKLNSIEALVAYAATL